MNKLPTLLAILTLTALAQISVQASETFIHEIESGAEDLFQDIEQWFEHF